MDISIVHEYGLCRVVPKTGNKNKNNRQVAKKVVGTDNPIRNPKQEIRTCPESECGNTRSSKKILGGFSFRQGLKVPFECFARRVDAADAARFEHTLDTFGGLVFDTRWPPDEEQDGAV